VKVAPDKSIEEVLRKFTRVHDKIITIMLRFRIDYVVNEKRIGKGDCLECVVPMDGERIDDLVELLYGASFSYEVGET
jgi:hypothetical protein